MKFNLYLSLTTLSFILSTSVSNSQARTIEKFEYRRLNMMRLDQDKRESTLPLSQDSLKRDSMVIRKFGEAVLRVRHKSNSTSKGGDDDDDCSDEDEDKVEETERKKEEEKDDDCEEEIKVNDNSKVKDGKSKSDESTNSTSNDVDSKTSHTTNLSTAQSSGKSDSSSKGEGKGKSRIQSRHLHLISESDASNHPFPNRSNRSKFLRSMFRSTCNRVRAQRKWRIPQLRSRDKGRLEPTNGQAFRSQDAVSGRSREEFTFQTLHEVSSNL